jgi:hypothetical protein
MNDDMNEKDSSEEVTSEESCQEIKCQKYAAVTFTEGGICILPLEDTSYEYMHRLDIQLQPMVGGISSVFEYVWKGFRDDFDSSHEGQLSTIYIDNMCGKVNLTGLICPALLQVAKLENPSFHFGIKYKFFTVHGQYMMQSNKKCLTFKGCKDVSFVNGFIAKLTGEHNVISQRPIFDMVSVTCAFNRSMSIAMGSLFDTMLRCLFTKSVKMNTRSDEDTQQMHFKVTDWTPFLEHIHEGNYLCKNTDEFDAEKLALKSVTSVRVNANGVFKVRFTWVAPFSCSDQTEINRFACLANAMCIVLLSKIGVI